MRSNFGNTWMSVLALLIVSACGAGNDTPEAVTVQTANRPADQSDGVCGMLSREQAATVISDNDGGKEQSATTEALFQDVEFAHCRYVHAGDTGVSWLDLLVYRASSGEGFEQIKIAEWAHQGSSQRLDIGDIAYLHDMSDEGEMVATASKGRTVFELKLYSGDAAAKSDQLIELARIVAGKI